MPSSCKDIRAALAACLQESECVMVQRNSAADCLRSPLVETLPTQCQQLKKGYAECKRGMIDMRKRFRGNKPIGLNQDETSQGGAAAVQEVPMLYAGKSAGGSGVKSTSGEDDLKRL